MDERDVHPVQPQPPEASFERGEHAVPAVVPHPGQGRGSVELLGPVYGPGRGHQKPPHLGGHGEFGSGPARQEIADAPHYGVSKARMPASHPASSVCAASSSLTGAKRPPMDPPPKTSGKGPSGPGASGPGSSGRA